MSKHGLSRQAKKYRDESREPGKKPTPSPKQVVPPPAQPAVPPPPQPVVQEESVAQPTTAAPDPQPEVPKPKRSRVVFVRPKVEKKPQTKVVPLPPRSAKLNAKLMSKNLVLPPKEDRPGGRPKA